MENKKIPIYDKTESNYINYLDYVYLKLRLLEKVSNLLRKEKETFGFSYMNPLSNRNNENTPYSCSGY